MSFWTFIAKIMKQYLLNKTYVSIHDEDNYPPVNIR